MRRGSKLKALGARHSFNGIADSTGEHISLKGLASMELDAKARTVTVGAGITMGSLHLISTAAGLRCIIWLRCHMCRWWERARPRRTGRG